MVQADNMKTAHESNKFCPEVERYHRATVHYRSAFQKWDGAQKQIGIYA